MSKVWLVTGCSRGLGRALAEVLLAEGERLVATARSVSDLAFLPPGERLRTIALDVTDAEATRAAVAAATSAFGRLDVAVGNAGHVRAESVEDESEAEFRRQMEVNFFGAYHLARAALPVMRAQRNGHLMFVSSIGARLAAPGLGAYQSAKAAVSALSEVLAKEVGPLGLRVTCVEPGGMHTDMFGTAMLSKTLSPDYEPTIGATIRRIFGDPSAATSDPRRVATAMLRLAAEKAPPVRVLLGSDAVKASRAVLAERARSDERWEELSVSTDVG